jgi:HD-like signal output (HDOD) protein
MRRILFVDDEPRILDGLRRLLRCLRGEWEMVFAGGGAEALDCCAAAPFDVVVSDAQMPGMDGTAFLGEILRLYPDTVRMILSGQCSRDSAIRSVGVAHQFLSKPCDPERLKSAVRSVCAMRDRFRDGATRRALSCIQRLPSQAAAYAELVERVKSAARIERVAEIITRDVAMCAKAVQLVSSGFFGTPQRVLDPAHAVRLLGLENIRAMMAAPAVFVAGDSEGPGEGYLRLLNDHSRAVAAVAKQIAETVTGDRTLIADAHLSGMLHNTGTLALLESPLSRPQEARSARDSRAIAVWQGLEISSDAAGPDASGYLAALWGLPNPIVRAVSYHRAPAICPDQTFGPLTAVHAAHALLEQSESVFPGEAAGLDMDYLRRTGCAGRLEDWREICAAHRPEGVLQ